MTVTFNSNLEGVDWIANYARDEYQFEILREQLLFNYIYSNHYFLILEGNSDELPEEKSLRKYHHWLFDLDTKTPSRRPKKFVIPAQATYFLRSFAIKK